MDFEQSEQMNNRIERLLQSPCWIIDILPRRVPKDSPGQYFAVEEYYLERERLMGIKQKHINVILKLSCYMDVPVEGKMIPEPEKIAEAMTDRDVYIMVGDSMILSEPEDTHMTVFNPDGELLEMLKPLSLAEGLFVWQA